MSDALPLKIRSEGEVRHLIGELIRELAPDPKALFAENSRLVDDLGYHSLALLELAFTLEDEFGLEPIDQETAERIVTVKDVEDYVIAKITAQRLATEQ